MTCWPRLTLGKHDMTGQAVQFAGAVALSAVDQLRAIGKVSPPLLEALLDFLCDGNEWAAERLAREPGWVLDAALHESDSKVLVAHLNVIDDYDIAQLKLGKKATELYAKATELHEALTATLTAARGCGSPTRRSTRRAPPT